SRIENNKLALEAVVLSADGQERITATSSGAFEEATEIGIQVAQKLLEAGAGRLISTDGDS
ncbi:MAG: hypothetical protein KDA77_02910, partial [Planctomycetaceae bacterium]|nr:hypothetical protein [Planctomycetaceae bacterium]